jgi:pimeloyl-ACP methyl ester carboxylesterase
MGCSVDDRWPGPHVANDAANGVDLYRANIFQKVRANDSAQTDVPVLLLVSKADPFVTPAFLDGIEAIATDLERRDLDCAHWGIRSHPDLVAELVEEFIAGH